MGRGAKYETHVKPYLDNIKNWIQLQNEGDIAKRLGISRQTLEKYKKEHEELRKALKEGRAELVEDLKLTLKSSHQKKTQLLSQTHLMANVWVILKQLQSWKKHCPNVWKKTLLNLHTSSQQTANLKQTTAKKQTKEENCTMV